MTTHTTMFFWIAAGFMAGLAASFFVLRLWRAGAASGWHASRWLSMTVVIFLTVSISVYLSVGAPPGVNAVVQPDGHPVSGDANATMRSMAEVTAQLESRLAKGGGNDQEWQLLQQAYQAVGNDAAAAAAAQQRLPESAGRDVSGTGPGSPSADIPSLQQRVKANAGDAVAWRALAERYRTARQFSDANAAYGEVIRLKAMDADAWADYADSVASAGNTLANDQTRHALEAALKLDARHPKALWLKASLLLEQKRYAESLAVWQQLRAVIGAASPDIRIIDANIAEAEALAHGSPASVAAKATNSGQSTIRGSVELDAALRSKLMGKTLFVFARAADSPAPVAVYRVEAVAWPVHFTLDDSLAMMPTRKLSDYAQVQVQARISQSGQAVAREGDWQSAIKTVRTRGDDPLSLIISQPVVTKAGS